MKLQFSLRSTLFALFMFLVWLGLMADAAHRQRDALANLADVTQTVEYDYQRPSEGAEISYSREPRGWPWLRDLLGGDYFDTVVGISLAGHERPVDDIDLVSLSRLSHLRYAMINGGTAISPGGCAPLSHLSSNLHELYCSGLPGEALPRIATLDGLRVLFFTDSQFHDSTVHYLILLPRLKELVLSRSTLGDFGMSGVGGLTSLKRLGLRDTLITDQGLAELALMDELEDLDLSGTRITDVGLAIHIVPLRALRTLDLTATRITDAAVASLKRLPNIKSICVARTKMTADGVAQLQTALPACRIATSRASPEGDDF